MENTIKNNRLIAVFMGVDFNKDRDKCNHPLIDAPWPPIECLKYHSSWNWLMPVVEKIVNDNSVRILIDTNGVKDSIAAYINSVRPIKQALMRANFKGIYEGVLQFINWYNSNQPPTINQ